MADNKVFAGPKVRRLRNSLDLTQTAMAATLGISPSYLNLIERDQRPLTVQLLLKMAQAFSVDLGEWQGGDRDKTVAELRRIFADPLIAGELPGEGELVELADAAPNVAAAFAKLHRAYGETQARLSDLSAAMGRGEGPALKLSRMPLDEVREVLEGRPHHHAALETAAEALRAEIGTGGDDVGGALRRWLRERHDISVRILPVEVMPLWRRRFDRHSRRLFLSERLDAAGRLREMAAEAVRLAFGGTVEAEVASFGFSGGEAERIGGRELTRYGALALLMPYGPFREAAAALGYDLQRLTARFGVGFADAAERLTSLQRRAAPGPPFFFLEADPVGHVLRRSGARGFPAALFGGFCARLPHVRAGDGVLAERAEMPDGSAYLLVARAEAGLGGDWPEPGRRTRVLLGCDWEAAEDTVYAKALRGGPAIGIGPACRHCEREACASRAEPPLTRPLALDEWVSGLTPYDFR
ncbi:short-chain fatty acyl-CoA regulator family protein [Aureimonas sp. SK2]|uniref:helix-turn-helix domain-containing protein n=1 Tax=Aureimonas sp. SK2 TaxID=3015992 RepID=UPI002443A639|nr:short-chain fatty acyl-CoA regulator family protein [Aureimonas sp. SK2]